MSSRFQIISFYEFKRYGESEELLRLKSELRQALVSHEVFGTIIIATEGFNASLCSRPENVGKFIADTESILGTVIEPKSSFHSSSPFRRQEVRIKPEIVSLRKPVDVSLGAGTHVDACDWNSILADPDVYLLDTRNDYEYLSGTFPGAVNPRTSKFSELPGFVENELDPEKNKKIAMFCTGGIRCEKFAPYLKQLGFSEVYQLRGGVLKYLEEVPAHKQLWEGECFVFDERISLNRKLNKGSTPDLSQRHHERTTE